MCKLKMQKALEITKMMDSGYKTGANSAMAREAYRQFIGDDSGYFEFTE